MLGHKSILGTQPEWFFWSGDVSHQHRQPVNKMSSSWSTKGGGGRARGQITKAQVPTQHVAGEQQNQQTTDIAIKTQTRQRSKTTKSFWTLHLCRNQGYVFHAWLHLVLRILVISVPVASGKGSIDSDCSTLVIRPLGQAVLGWPICYCSRSELN